MWKHARAGNAAITLRLDDRYFAPGHVLVLFCGWMGIAGTFSGILGRRPTASELFRRPERENRPPYTASSVDNVGIGFVLYKQLRISYTLVP